MIEVHKQWLNEFDVEAARRRRMPHKVRETESPVRTGFLRRRRNEAAPQPCEA